VLAAADGSPMQVAVLGAGFAVGVVVFVAWLVVMLHHDKTHRMAVITAAHEHTRSHRRAALAARYAPDGAPSVPVVKAGSFCRVPGNVGHSKSGTILVCEANGSGRPRWRRADIYKIAS
jgi:hypothetical protein